MLYNSNMTYGIIYYWYCEKTNMGYVGQTVNTLSGRWKGHCQSAFNPKSKTGHWKFPEAIRLHGKDAFVGRVLCECASANELSIAEDKYMHELNTLWPNGYNMRDGTNFVCEQTRKLISERTKEAMRNVDPSCKVRQKASMKDLEVRKKISDRTKEAMQRPEVKEKMEISYDVTWRSKISETLKGHTLSTETRQKISETLKSKPKKQKPSMTCKCCKTSFVVKKKLQQFCSPGCYWSSMKENHD